MPGMLFMVIEKFRDTDAIGDRFRKLGRMMPDNLTYVSSWIDPARDRCYQLMEAPNVEAFGPWLDAWADLADFEVIPVVPSQEFWSARAADTT